ncbi:helix-turn-helix domain-containing protein [Fulvivirga kasyanovii]|uniref:AraC family transcriptional regulator n=1 Tax=Fulvivirga kasyanovii TaxID=396812 RepID=A0ABW9RSS1_9BACT|nr:helix-turn-helix domain-containing protein [Fulvivirga kasyanovii]MTI27209.1 AraC family transcriptional regulator [Fulvivirga kasyanovii]
MLDIFLDLVVVASGVLGCFISVALLTTPFYKSKANAYLSLSMLILVGITLLGWYSAEGGIFEFLQGVMWEFLVAATLFHYFLIHIQHEYLKRSWLKWLYLPFIVALLADTFLSLDFIFNLYDSSFHEEGIAVEVIYGMEAVLSLAYNIILILWSRHLTKHSQNISKEKKHWLLRLNLFIIIIILVWLLSDIEDFLLNSEFSSDLLWLVLSFLSWWVLYYGVFRLQIIVQKDEIHQRLIAGEAAAPVDKKKKAIATASRVIKQLYKLMDEDELFKNPLLSRYDLAKQLNISEGHLSQIVNQEINKSTIQFVNEYRVGLAKKLLHNPAFDKYSIEAIGMEAGFKSKSVFYNIFKTASGMSPGAYRKLREKS